MPKNVAVDVGEPGDMLGRIAEAALEAARAHPDYRESTRAIVLVDDFQLKRGTSGDNYGEEPEADAFRLSRLLEHATAIAMAHGVMLKWEASRPDGERMEGGTP